MVEHIVDLVGLLVGGLVLRVGEGLCLGLDDLHGLAQVLPDARADAGDQHRAVGAALVGGGHGVHRQVEYVGLHLPPQHADAAAAGGVDLLILGEFAEDLQDFPKDLVYLLLTDKT